MTPSTRARLVRQWQRFSRAYEAVYIERDDAVDTVTIGDVINDAGPINALNRTRAIYLKGLVEAGLVDARWSVPDDDRLWELHPVNVCQEDLYP